MSNQKALRMCATEDCQRQIAPSDGVYCGLHSKKLATPVVRIERISSAGQIARKGINDTNDFGKFLAALAGDVVDGSVDPESADVALKISHAMLRLIELRMKYGPRVGLGDASGVAQVASKCLPDGQGDGQ
jgi:hypothetical protein